jgi:hypothetical protein
MGILATLAVFSILEGDPLRYLLQPSVARLRSVRRELAPVLLRRPEVARVLDAIIEYRAESCGEP